MDVALLTTDAARQRTTKSAPAPKLPQPPPLPPPTVYVSVVERRPPWLERFEDLEQRHSQNPPTFFNKLEKMVDIAAWRCVAGGCFGDRAVAQASAQVARPKGRGFDVALRRFERCIEACLTSRSRCAPLLERLPGSLHQPYCATCGSRLARKARFCSECGAAAPSSPHSLETVGAPGLESLQELNKRHASEETPGLERFIDRLVWRCAAGQVAASQAKAGLLASSGRDDDKSAYWPQQLVRSALDAVGRAFSPHELTPFEVASAFEKLLEQRLRKALCRAPKQDELAIERRRRLVGELTSALGRDPTTVELNEHLRLRLQASLDRSPTVLELFVATAGVRESRLRHILGRSPTKEEMREAEVTEVREAAWAKVGRAVSTPLVPTRLAALAGASRSLRTTLQPMLAELRKQHGMARDLCRKLGRTPRELPSMIELNGEGRGLTDSDLGTLSQLIPFGALASCRYVHLSNNKIGEWGIRALANVLSRGRAKPIAC